MSIKPFINKTPSYKILPYFLPCPYKMIVFLVKSKSLSTKGTWRTIRRGCPVLKLPFPFRLSHLEKVTSSNLISSNNTVHNLGAGQFFSNKVMESRCGSLAPKQISEHQCESFSSRLLWKKTCLILSRQIHVSYSSKPLAPFPPRSEKNPSVINKRRVDFPTLPDLILTCTILAHSILQETEKGKLYTSIASKND